jgi:antitoxin YefM
MYSVYRLNADDLDQNFLEAVRSLFRHKEIEITVYESDETAYLLSSPVNRAQLLQAVADVENGLNIVVPPQEQFQ